LSDVKTETELLTTDILTGRIHHCSGRWANDRQMILTFSVFKKFSDFVSRQVAKFENRPTFAKIFDPPLDVGLAVF